MRFLAASTAIGAMALVAAVAAPALAADYPVLRGSQFDDTPARDFGEVAPSWGGLYVGGTANFINSSFDARVQSLALNRDAFHQRSIGDQVSGLVQLGKKGRDRTQFGGFAGYNFGFGDVILGLEAEYQKADLQSDDIRSDSRIFQGIKSGNLSGGFITGSHPLVAMDPGSIYEIEPLRTETTARVTIRSQNEIRDFGVIKARAGYAFGNFMPFLSIGAAAAKINTKASLADYNYTDQHYNIYSTRINSEGDRVRDAMITRHQTQIDSEYPRPTTIYKSGYVPGLALGGGIDALLGEHVLLRAEVQRIYFSDFKGVEATVDTARVGAGIKF